MYGGSGEVSAWAELLSAAVGPPGAEQVRVGHTASATSQSELQSHTMADVKTVSCCRSLVFDSVLNTRFCGRARRAAMCTRSSSPRWSVMPASGAALPLPDHAAQHATIWTGREAAKAVCAARTMGASWTWRCSAMGWRPSRQTCCGITRLEGSRKRQCLRQRQAPLLLFGFEPNLL